MGLLQLATGMAENAAYVRPTMRRLEDGTFPCHETPDNTRNEVRRKVFR